FEAITVACDVARRTQGAVDPTVGIAVESLGYDRDFALVSPTGPTLPDPPRPAPGWWRIALDERTRMVSVPPGIRLDLGATAKALAADRAATRIATVTGSGALVSLGGDVSVAGPSPDGGWPIGIAVDSSSPTWGPVVALVSGGLASSSTEVRSWR